MVVETKKLLKNNQKVCFSIIPLILSPNNVDLEAVIIDLESVDSSIVQGKSLMEDEYKGIDEHGRVVFVPNLS